MMIEVMTMAIIILKMKMIETSMRRIQSNEPMTFMPYQSSQVLNTSIILQFQDSLHLLFFFFFSFQKYQSQGIMIGFYRVHHVWNLTNPVSVSDLANLPESVVGLFRLLTTITSGLTYKTTELVTSSITSFSTRMWMMFPSHYVSKNLALQSFSSQKCIQDYDAKMTMSKYLMWAD